MAIQEPLQKALESNLECAKTPKNHSFLARQQLNPSKNSILIPKHDGIDKNLSSNLICAPKFTRIPTKTIKSYPKAQE